MIRIVPHHFYTSIVDAPPLIGNECMYPDILAEPLIRTFSKEIMTPFYFKVGDLYLQPKYTTNQDVFGLCIVVSDEVYTTDYAELVIAYNLPMVDILSLKRNKGLKGLDVFKRKRKLLILIHQGRRFQVLRQ